MNNKKRISTIIAASIISVLIIGIIFFINYNKPLNRAQRIVSKMTTDEKIGQIFMLAFREWKPYLVIT